VAGITQVRRSRRERSAVAASGADERGEGEEPRGPPHGSGIRPERHGPRPPETSVLFASVAQLADHLDVRRLAQYRPFEGGAEGMEAVHDDLVMAACQSNDGSFTSLEACGAFIKESWRIQLEIGEIREARDRLAESGLARRVGGGLELSPGARKRLEEEREGWERAESEAFLEWEGSVRGAFPSLDDEGIGTLREQFRPWLDQVIARHGAEASLLLYPEHARAEQLFESLATTDLGFLPDCDPDVDAVRVSAFRMFVREPTPAQREFLGRLLNTGFYLTVLSLDPRASHLVEAEAKQTTLYLDTNFLYSVLGVGGASEAYAATRLLQLCRDLGYSLRITPWTVDELRTSIASSRTDVNKFHRSRKSAHVMAEVSGEKGFAPAYWRELRDKGTSPEDFFGKHGHFMRFLEDNGISEHPEGCSEVEKDVDAIRAYASPLEGLFGVGAKRREVIEHDAKLRLLIERLRGNREPVGYTEVHFWFLTESTRLPTYARMPIDSGHRPAYPFCILSSSWAQIVRALTPRTEDLNDVIVGLLASPYVGYKSPVQGIESKAVARVVSRIDSLTDIPPRVAIALVNDRSMAQRIGEETDDEEVDQLVEASLTEKALQLEEQVSATAQRAAAAERAREQADERARAAAEDLESAKAASDEEQERARREQAVLAEKGAAEAARLRGEHATREEELRGQVVALEESERAERDRRKSAERRARQLRNAIAMALAAVIAAVSVGLLASGTVSGRAAAIAVISVATIAAFAALRLISASLAEKAIWAFTVLVGVASVVAAIWPQNGH
jgi:hypothetical protein